MINLLDHGSLSLVESWGSDERIIEAARMSTAKGFLGWGPKTVCADCAAESADAHGAPPCGHTRYSNNVPGDEKLLRFLYENKHATPFEMVGMVIEVKAPIFVFREWHRHRTQSYNEMSARYVPLPDENYIPSVERLMIGSDGKNKQAGTIAGAGVLTVEGAERFRAALGSMYEWQEGLYQTALATGVPKELARIHLPVGRYSRMRASANLRNWLGFLSLRMAPGAQWEIRQYANAVGSLIAESFPRTWALFEEGRG